MATTSHNGGSRQEVRLAPDCGHQGGVVSTLSVSCQLGDSQRTPSMITLNTRC